MPRSARLHAPGLTWHVTQRAVNGMPCFLAEYDFRSMKRMLFCGAARHGCAVHAYVIMTNHLHVLMSATTERSLSDTMKFIAESYARYFNHRHRRRGHLWQGRFRASLVEEEHYLLACYRYIEMNPVNAALVDSPGHYEWSSYRENAGGMPGNGLSAHSVYLAMAPDAAARGAAYRACFDAPDAARLYGRIRLALRRGRVCGSPAFVAYWQSHRD